MTLPGVHTLPRNPTGRDPPTHDSLPHPVRPRRKMGVQPGTATPPLQLVAASALEGWTDARRGSLPPRRKTTRVHSSRLPHHPQPALQEGATGGGVAYGRRVGGDLRLALPFLRLASPPRPLKDVPGVLKREAPGPFAASPPPADLVPSGAPTSPGKTGSGHSGVGAKVGSGIRAPGARTDALQGAQHLSGPSILTPDLPPPRPRTALSLEGDGAHLGWARAEPASEHGQSARGSSGAGARCPS